MKKFLPLLFCFFLALCPLAGALDFGVLLEESGGITGQGSGTDLDYSGSLIPRLEAFIGGNGRLYASAGLKLEYQDESFSFVPEILRTELSFGFGSMGFRLGRMHYSDPLGFVANGLFDGAQIYFDTAAGIVSYGVWYTGLLHKNRTPINMTGLEQDSDYFASRRVLAALDWEHPALGEFVSASVSLLGQFDQNSSSDLHSQYLAAKLTVPAGNFVFDLGGVFSFVQDDGETSVSAAGEIGAAWMLPTPFFSRLSLWGRFSSGYYDDGSVSAFLPLTTNSQGDILKAKLSGLSVISLDYLARLHRLFSLGLSASCFIRNDLGTYAGYPVNAGGDDGYVLGTEFYTRLFWSPLSDISLNLGAGAFLPALGNTASGADPLWRVELNFIFSVY